MTLTCAYLSSTTAVGHVRLLNCMLVSQAAVVLRALQGCADKGKGVSMTSLPAL